MKTSVKAKLREAHSRTNRYNDLRDLIEIFDQMGELKRVDGADWNLEIGAILELLSQASREGMAPAVLFDGIPGYPKGHRIFSGSMNSSRRLAYLLGFGEPETPTAVVQAYRNRMRSDFKLIPPVYLSSGPVFENIDRDEDVDLFKFPAPFLHEKDGGRYIGTDVLVITKDRDSDWVNSATYRIMLQNKNTCGIWMSPGKHGRLISQKYFSHGEPCPVAISLGHDPLLFMAANQEIDLGTDEFAYAGGHRGAPYEMVKTELHGLPIPAHAEIVLEGEIYGNETLPEGPFGEFMGYYASDVSEEPVIKIRRVYYRSHPILCVASPGRPPTSVTFGRSIVKSAMIWDEIEKAGLPGVKGVWCHEAGASRLFNIVSIEQQYPGHARQAAFLAATCHAGNYAGRWVIVVDEDIDPTNTFDVLWAMSTRCDPPNDIDFIRRAWSTPLDPMLAAPPYENNRAIIDACRPWGRRASFPQVTESSPELKEKMHRKYRELFK
ncbi:MAG: hypothetical protein A3G25_09295 [Betaproteobacteria bacterium RIFCSPLOWO2_12_FULL_63_13]|nr:MAG: hypothetical protein A3G25_09295 [Betaproteobacteria bacterium RIFCSPLOWO2_12_FULL_63_13]